MLDPTVEPPLTLREAAKLPELRRNGRRPHLSALYRWVTIGVRGIVLESICIAGSRCVTREGVARWTAALTAQANGTVQPTRTPLRRQQAHIRDDSNLAQDGW